MDNIQEEIQNAFEELGVTYDNTVLNKCVEICEKYNVSNGEEFVDTWMAYSLSKLHGESPTISYLNKFERDEFSKRNKKNEAKEIEIQKSSLTIYEANNTDVDMQPALDILKMYCDNSSKEKKNGAEARTPDYSNKNRNKCSPQAIFSPASFSPTITSLSSKYTSRTNAGEVVLQYKNEKLASATDNLARSAVKINRRDTLDIQRYMNFELLDFLEYADDLIDKLGNILLKKYGLEDPVAVTHRHPSPFVTYGRIACDSEGRLNSKSVILEGSRETSLGEFIQLDLGPVNKYSVFPGQVVAVEGINISNSTLIAQKIFYDASSELRPGKLSNDPINIFIAAGPFTQSDSMTYQPLLDLLECVASDEPDVLILTGPFIDCNHPVISENSLAETYQVLFEKIIDQILKRLRGKKTQVVVVSSHRDCNSHYVYPTPELPSRSKGHPNLHFLPDPSVFSVDDLIVGITSTDILMHIGKEEISSAGYSTDRLSRLASHIISQRSFYPLMPAAGVPVDPHFIEFAKLNDVPHILILPSDLRFFIKEVFGCVVVNPERLAKGLIGGTYARLNVTASGTEGRIIRI